MADLHQSPTSLCCCRKPPSGSGARWVGDSASPEPDRPRCPLVDVASASNFRHFQLRHFHLDLKLNFAVKEMSGWLVLDLVPVQPGVQTLVLDSHPSLLIHAIDCKVPGAGEEPPSSLTYRVDPFTDFGSSLHISLPVGTVKPGRPVQITVRYTTTDGPAVSSPDGESPVAPPVRWVLNVCVAVDLVAGLGTDLRPDPAPGLHPGPLGLQPVLLPLLRHPGGQEHLHRHGPGESAAGPAPFTPQPLDSSPSLPQVPDGVTVLMSASQSSYSKRDRVFQFSMEFPIPSYLVALVAGDLQHVDVGPR